MCAGGHSLHKADWLKIALGLAAAGTGAGALGLGPLAGIMGGGAAAGLGLGETGAVAGDAFMPGLLADEMGAGAGAGGLSGSMAAGGGPQSFMSQMQTGGMNLLGGSQNYDKAAKLSKLGMKAQSSGLLGGGQQRPTPLAAPQPGGGAQMPGAPTSAQIAFPDAYQPAPPYFPLNEMLRRRREQEGY